MCCVHSFSSQAPGSEKKSVKLFGVVGNGMANDLKALQKAFLSDTPIYFPKGVYRVAGDSKFHSNSPKNCLEVVSNNKLIDLNGQTLKLENSCLKFSANHTRFDLNGGVVDGGVISLKTVDYIVPPKEILPGMFYLKVSDTKNITLNDTLFSAFSIDYRFKDSLGEYISLKRVSKKGQSVSETIFRLTPIGEQQPHNFKNGMIVKAIDSVNGWLTLTPVDPKKSIWDYYDKNDEITQTVLSEKAFDNIYELFPSILNKIIPAGFHVGNYSHGRESLFKITGEDVQISNGQIDNVKGYVWNSFQVDGSTKVSVNFKQVKFGNIGFDMFYLINAVAKFDECYFGHQLELAKQAFVLRENVNLTVFNSKFARGNMDNEFLIWMVDDEFSRGSVEINHCEFNATNFYHKESGNFTRHDEIKFQKSSVIPEYYRLAYLDDALNLFKINFNKPNRVAYFDKLIIKNSTIKNYKYGLIGIDIHRPNQIKIDTLVLENLTIGSDVQTLAGFWGELVFDFDLFLLKDIRSQLNTNTLVDQYLMKNFFNHAKSFPTNKRATLKNISISGYLLEADSEFCKTKKVWCY
jgi:hypothetical protein